MIGSHTRAAGITLIVVALSGAVALGDRSFSADSEAAIQESDREQARLDITMLRQFKQRDTHCAECAQLTRTYNDLVDQAAVVANRLEEELKSRSWQNTYKGGELVGDLRRAEFAQTRCDLEHCRHFNQTVEARCLACRRKAKAVNDFLGVE